MRDAEPFAFDIEGRGLDEAVWADRNGRAKGVFQTIGDLTVYHPHAELIRRHSPTRPTFPPGDPKRQRLVDKFRAEHPELRSGLAQYRAYRTAMGADPTLPELCSRDFRTTKARPGPNPKGRQSRR